MIENTMQIIIVTANAVAENLLTRNQYNLLEISFRDAIIKIQNIGKKLNN